MSPKKDRPHALKGYTVEKSTHCGKIYVTVNFDQSTNEILEVLIRFGRAGGCASAMADGTARLISYALRSGMSPKDAVKALNGIGCHLGGNTCLHNIADAISCVMEALETEKDLEDVIEDRINAELTLVEVCL